MRRKNIRFIFVGGVLYARHTKATPVRWRVKYLIVCICRDATGGSHYLYPEQFRALKEGFGAL
jgi:hypothetical protein